MRLVLDTNVVMSALLWRGAPYQLLTNIRDRAESISLFCSTPLLAELADVLARPAAAKQLAVIKRSAADSHESRKAPLSNRPQTAACGNRLA